MGLKSITIAEREISRGYIERILLRLQHLTFYFLLSFYGAILHLRSWAVKAVLLITVFITERYSMWNVIILKLYDAESPIE